MNPLLRLCARRVSLYLRAIVNRAIVNNVE